MKVMLQWEGPDGETISVAVEEPVDGGLLVQEMCVAALILWREAAPTDREETT